MSGTTNFPTASWTMTATDNVGVVNSACWEETNMDYPHAPWNPATQSYDYSVVTNLSGSQFPIGNTSIQCAATDAAGNNGWFSFSVKVKGHKLQINSYNSSLSKSHVCIVNHVSH